MWEMFNLFNTANLADYNGNAQAVDLRAGPGGVVAVPGAARDATQLLASFR